MKRWFLAVLLAAIAILYTFAPGQVEAYSYGDANTEDVAETFKLVETSLAGGANGWAEAEEAYKVRRSEISAHFGEPVAVTLDANFKARDSKLVVSNFKAVLVMNLDRRFTYAFDAVKDYAGAKLLLAKAKATFDTLSPYMSGNTADIDKAFDAALDALGNPGLFGVGKKAVQPEVFKERVDFIYNKVKPLFPYQATAAATPTPAATPAPTATPPEATPAPIATPAPTATNSPAVVTPAPTPAPAVAGAAETPGAKPSDTPGATPSPSATPSATPTTTAPPTATPAATSTAAPTASPAATSKPADASADSASVVNAAAHAPMERTNKTNSYVSILVIAGVVIVAGGGFWLARKKKWI